jgi:hypothetical protein
MWQELTQDEMAWYLIISSLFIAPAYSVAAILWWKRNTVQGTAAKSMKAGIVLAALSFVPLLAFLYLETRDPFKAHILKDACRWLGEGFAITAVVCALLGRGWMRITLAAFSGWSFAYTFFLLNPK